MLTRTTLQPWDDLIIVQSENKCLYRFADLVTLGLPKVDQLGLNLEDRDFILAVFIYYEFLNGTSTSW